MCTLHCVTYIWYSRPVTARVTGGSIFVRELQILTIREKASETKARDHFFKKTMKNYDFAKTRIYIFHCFLFWHPEKQRKYFDSRVRMSFFPVIAPIQPDFWHISPSYFLCHLHLENTPKPLVTQRFAILTIFAKM